MLARLVKLLARVTDDVSQHSNYHNNVKYDVSKLIMFVNICSLIETRIDDN